MNINFYLDDSELEFLLNANDPEHETWKSINALTEKEVADMLQSILSAWIETH